MKKLILILGVLALLGSLAMPSVAQDPPNGMILTLVHVNSASHSAQQVYGSPIATFAHSGGGGQYKMYGTLGYSIYLINQNVATLSQISAVVQGSPDGADWFNIHKFNSGLNGQYNFTGTAPVSHYIASTTTACPPYFRVSYVLAADNHVGGAAGVGAGTTPVSFTIKAVLWNAD